MLYICTDLWRLNDQSGNWFDQSPDWSSDQSPVIGCTVFGGFSQGIDRATIDDSGDSLLILRAISAQKTVDFSSDSVAFLGGLTSQRIGRPVR